MDALNLRTQHHTLVSQLATTYKRNPHSEPHVAASQLEGFLTTLDQPYLFYDKTPLLVTKDCVLSLKGRQVFIVSGSPIEQDCSLLDAADPGEPVAVMLVNCAARQPKNKKFRAILLLNGDDNSNWYADEFDSLRAYDFPTVSFACLAQFYDPEGTWKNCDRLYRRLADGSIRLLDYRPDERRDVTDAQRKLLRKKKGQIKPPAPGFTLMRGRGQHWHRSATVLFHDTEKGWYLLMGQDEGTYFGIQLAGPAKTVDEAFKGLIPVELLGRTDYKRQGEWFMVPVADKDVPSQKDAALLFETEGQSYDQEVYLPIDDAVSNHHTLCTSEGRVGKDGRVYAHQASLMHDEHISISHKGWCVFLRNTAVRSVSQQGVD